MKHFPPNARRCMRSRERFPHASRVMRGRAREASQAEFPQSEMKQLGALFSAGRHVELESRVRSLLERYPDTGFLWKALGAALQEQGKDDLPALQKAVELLPEDAEAHYNLGNSLCNMGRLDDATACYRRALQIDPAYVKAHNNLGATLKALGRIDDAVASYRRALAIQPDYADAHRNLLLALGRPLRGDAAGAC